MANEITFIYTSGQTLTYLAYAPDGTPRITSTSLPEVGTTGYYTASAPTLVALDMVIIKSGANIIAGGQYKPEVSANVDLTEVINDLQTIDENIVTLSTAIIDSTGSVLNNWTNIPLPKRSVG